VVSRDLIGYGRDVPRANWPGGARVALQFVVNYEEGGERSILYGDDSSESYLGELPGTRPLPGARNPSMESIYEYGSRAGFWRLVRLFDLSRIPVTVFGVTEALRQNPDAVAAMQGAGWEIACHGLRWLDYASVGIEVERSHIARAIELHSELTGERPLGWYTGRTSANTRRLVADAGGFLYDSDSYADDLPYWCLDHGEPLLIVPYTLDVNDMRFATHQGFNTGEQFFTYLKDTFDVLYAEGERFPKLLNVGLHCRLVGRPGRLSGLARFIDYTKTFDRVWYCRRVDVARHWPAEHPP
jgi:putative urate catabolism protein